MTPPSDNEITLTDLPAVKGKPPKRDYTPEITLTMAWRAPKDAIVIIDQHTDREDWVRVTDSVGNGPYQITVTPLTAGQRWWAKFRMKVRALVRWWKHRAWWPFIDFLEDVWQLLIH